METGNGDTVKELVQFVREQREMNKRIVERIEDAGKHQEAIHAEFREEFREHHREHKVLEQRWQRIFREHERWMRALDNRMTVQYHLVRKLADKLL